MCVAVWVDELTAGVSSSLPEKRLGFIAFNVGDDCTILITVLRGRYEKGILLQVNILDPPI